MALITANYFSRAAEVASTMLMSSLHLNHHHRMQTHHKRAREPLWLFALAGLGGFTPGIVPLVLGRIYELLPHNSTGQRAAWAQATTSFALLQAVGAYGLSYGYARSGGNYAMLFAIGAPRRQARSRSIWLRACASGARNKLVP
jgi:4-amino-4-deoxy-L-arabinose transferase-like glycosyltransferase